MVFYDEITDILMINFKQPQEAITDQVGDRIHIRFDPVTNEPVGLVITAFKKGFLQEHPDLAKAFETFERIKEEERR